MNRADPDSLAENPPVTSMYVWGPNRSRVNAAARVVAERLDPGYQWLEVRVPEEPASEAAAGVAPHPVFEAEDLLPGRGVSAEWLWSYLKPQGQHRAASELEEFLRMPEAIQEAVRTLLDPAVARPRVLVVANADLVCRLDPKRKGVMAPFIEFLNSREISFVVTATGCPCRDRAAFEYSVTISESLPEQFRTTAAVCQWGDCDACLVPRFSREELVCSSRLWENLRRGSAKGACPVGWASH
jgi:hypothetical protein